MKSFAIEILTGTPQKPALAGTVHRGSGGKSGNYVDPQSVEWWKTPHDHRHSQTVDIEVVFTPNKIMGKKLVSSSSFFAKF